MLIVLGIGVLLITHYRSRDEFLIRRTLYDLLLQCEKKGSSGLLATALRAQDIRNFFTTNAIVRTGPPYPMRLERRDLPALLARAHHYADLLIVRARGDELEVAPGRRTALLRITLEVEATIDGRVEQGIGEYEFTWQKEDGEWRISDVRHLDTIRHPDAGSSLP